MDVQNPGFQGFNPQPAPPIAYQAPMVAPTTLNVLARTRPWVRLMSMVGFVCAGFMVLAGLGMGAAGLAMGKPDMLMGLIIYVPSSLLYFIPSLYLHRYAGRISGLRATPWGQQLDAALDAQRAFWKFAGMVVVIGFVFTVLLILAAIVTWVARSARF